MDADVAVVGAGPAGAAAALYLARQGRSVVVVERQRFPRDKPCGEGLMPAGVDVLRELAVLKPLVDGGAPWIEGAVFSAPGAGSISARFPRGPGLGVRRLTLDAVLAEYLDAAPRVSLQQDCTAAGVSFGPLELSTSRGTLRVRAVVAADGLRSPLRKSLGWSHHPRQPHRYGLVGHVAGVDRPEPLIRVDLRTGYEVFTAPSGPNERLVALLGTKQLFQARNLETAYRDVVGQEANLTSLPAPIGPFNIFARTVAGSGVFLLGDAAGFLDPITGQGLETALLSARYLAGVLGRMLDGRLSAGQAAHLYGDYYRRSCRDLHRLTRLVLWLTASRQRSTRGIRGIGRRPAILETLLGINCGYWGFAKLTPWDWLAMLTGFAPAALSAAERPTTRPAASPVATRHCRGGA